MAEESRHLLPIYSVRLAAHNRVAQWEPGTANATVGKNVVTTDFGSAQKTATAKATAVIPSLATNRTFDIVLMFPSPPRALNLKSEDSVRLWLELVRDTPHIAVLVDTATGREPFDAVTENIESSAAIGFIVGSCVFIVIYTMVCVMFCHAECPLQSKKKKKKTWDVECGPQLPLPTTSDRESTSDDTDEEEEEQQQQESSPVPSSDREPCCKKGDTRVNSGGHDGAIASEEETGESEEEPSSDGSSASTGTNKCIVCRDREIAVILGPCGHYAFCENCAHRLQRCPSCRQEITTRLKVYNGR
jgi:hypothetical protein